MNNASKLLAAAIVTVLGALSVGCSSPCDTLKTTCGKCSAIYQPSCNVVVSAGNGDACKADQPTFTAACP